MSADAVTVPVVLQRVLPPEEAARGDFYALLARLLQNPPDAPLLAQLGAAPLLPEDGDPELGLAWQNLVEASSVMDADAAAEEYEKLFIGMGKAAVPIYAGFYGGAPAIAHPRVRIQADLAALGLARPATLNEPEDHYGGLLEVMRVLVAGGAGRAPAPLAQQKKFFDDHLKPGLAKFFEKVGCAPEANYYQNVAGVGAAFVAIESESFQLD